MNPMDRFRANLKNACTLKIQPEVWFSQKLAAYIRHLASYYQIDAHAMVLAIINGVASTCRSTYVNRASHFLVPCNLYNLVVARSGYSKSSILDLAELIAETAAIYFPEFDIKQQLNEQTREEILPDELELCAPTTATTNKRLNSTDIRRITSKVVFNDGTSAGVLNNLKQCTRTMHLHEADVTLKTLGLMLPSPFDITPSRVDPFRSTLMTLHEKPGHFLRVLKKENIDISGSKLNIFGASTGDIIAAELVRQTASLAADALFERFILWPVDGEPIPNEKCIESIDFSRYCSLEQFAILCGFFSDLILDLEQEGKDILAEQAFTFRVAGNQIDVKDNLSARLNKIGLACYRIAGLCGLVEAAFDMVDIYIEEYVTFGDGKSDEIFFRRCSKIAERIYGLILCKETRLVVDTEICKRANDVTVRNLAQYMALMKIHGADKQHWFNQSSKTMRTTMRFTTIEENNESSELIDTSRNSIGTASKADLPLTRKQKNMLANINAYKASILLHPSLVFLKSDLYANSFLKKASSLMEKIFLTELVAEGYLIDISEGGICCKSKFSVYIKMIPSDESKASFIDYFASLHMEKLNYETYMASCSNITLNTKGVISEEVLEVLRLERYHCLNINFESLPQRGENQYQDPNRNISASVFVEENDSIDSQIVLTTGSNDLSLNDEQIKRTSEHNEADGTNSVDNSSENNYDQRIFNSDEMMVTHEEVIEEEAEVNHTETEFLIMESSNKRQRNASHGETFEEKSFGNGSVDETIAERIRSGPRKRTKTYRK